MTGSLEGHLRHQIEHSGRFFWHRLRWRAIRSYLPQGEPFELIDVGAGAGLLGVYLTSEFPLAQYRYVEPIASLRKHLNTVFGTAADATASTDYHQAQYVTVLDVLEHQSDDRAFMRTVVERMNPGAVLLVTVPALPRLWSRWDSALGHFRRYHQADLMACLDGLPLLVDETSFLFPELVPLAALRARFGGIGKDQDTRGQEEFPNLPRAVNDIFYRFGSASVALRSRWSTGTSLFVAATRLDGPPILAQTPKDAPH
jgi:hypothetical protein